MFAIFPEILQAVQKGDLETLACLIRKYFAAQEIYSPRLSVEALLTQMGISVQTESGPGLGRIRAFDQKGQYIVILSLNVSIYDSASKNFTLAHLLGYFLLVVLPLMARGDLAAELYQLEGEPFDFASAVALQQQKQKPGRRLEEADRFAMALLLPQGMVKKAHQRFERQLDPTAKFFRVHPLLLEARLKGLGLGTKAVARETTEVKAQAKPRAEAAPKPATTSSVERAQKSLVSMSYRREENRKTQSEADPIKPEAAVQPLGVLGQSPKQGQAPSLSQSQSLNQAQSLGQSSAPGEGLKRLRELARKIDRSVDV